MLRNIFDRTEHVKETPEASSVLSPVGVQSLYDELMEELGQARAERAELIRLIKELRARLDAIAVASAPAAQAEVVPARARMGLFVDVQNIFYNARNFYGRKLDFKKLMEVTTKGRQLVSAVAYLVFSPDVDQSNFITMLEQNGYVVREKMPRRQGEEGSASPTEGLPMHEDILTRIAGLDIAVLVGSDGDVQGLTHAVHAAGAKAELYGFPQNVAGDVVRDVDRFCPIDEALMLNQEYVSRQGYHGNGSAQRAGAPPAGVGVAGRSARGYSVGQRFRGWSHDARGT